MKQIRSKVFETNSSSSHSLTVAPAEVVDFLFGSNSCVETGNDNDYDYYDYDD